MMLIPALTGLRLFAALAILLWHSQTGYFFRLGAFRPFFLAGAVPLFFVLSGFVLTIGIEKYRSWLDFFVARIARIWPAHLAALAFFIAVLFPFSIDLIQQPGGMRRLILNIFLLQDWSPNQATFWSYNAPSWSVSCEMFLYGLPIMCGSLGSASLAAAVRPRYGGSDRNRDRIPRLPRLQCGLAGSDESVGRASCLRRWCNCGAPTETPGTDQS